MAAGRLWDSDPAGSWSLAERPQALSNARGRQAQKRGSEGSLISSNPPCAGLAWWRLAAAAGGVDVGPGGVAAMATGPGGVAAGAELAAWELERASSLEFTYRISLINGSMDELMLWACA